MKSYYYDNIADDYHQKRKNPWPPLINYLQNQLFQNNEFKGLNLDIGCANGRHFSIFKKRENSIVGIDNSLEFLKIARDRIRNKTICCFNRVKSK